jgi:hypothetical protein
VMIGPGTWRARVAAGIHTLRAEAPRMETTVSTQAIRGGETLRLELPMFTELDEFYSVRKPLPPWAGYLVAGVGVEAAIAGGLLHASARAADADYRRERAACPAGDLACPLDPGLLALRDTSHARRGAAYALYGGGAALVAVGVTLVWYERKRWRRRSTVPEPGVLVRTRVAPLLGRDLAGLSAAGAF